MASSASNGMQMYRGISVSVAAPVLVMEPDAGERSTIGKALRALFVRDVRYSQGSATSNESACEADADESGLVICSTPEEAHRQVIHAAAQGRSFAIAFIGGCESHSEFEQDDVTATLFDEISRSSNSVHVVSVGEFTGDIDPNCIAATLRRPVRANELTALTRTLLADHARQCDRQYVQAMLATAQRVGDFAHWRWDQGNGRVSWSEALATMFGIDESGANEPIDSFWHCVHTDDRARVLAHMSSVRDGRGYGTLAFRIVHPREGVRRVHQESVLVERGVGGALLVSAVRDVTDNAGIEDTIRKLAFFDPLTELPNRSFLNEHLRTVLQHARRHDRKAAIVHVDLDSFKRVNGTLGHNAGDKLLQEVAVRLQSCVRDSDCVARDEGGQIWPTASAPDTVTRFGADEFIIVLSEVADVADSQQVAERILNRLQDPVDVGGRDVTIGASIGISVYPDHATNEDALLRNASLAMQFAKRAGRNTFACFNDTLATSGVARLNLEADLRRALQTGGLSLHYQPKVNARTGVTEGAEALLRWQHPEIGMVPPSDFIPIAEETGLVLPLGEWVIHEVCQQMANWARDGLQTVPVSVNVSVHQLHDESLVPKIVRELDLAGLTPRELEFEITESVLMEETGAAETRLRELRALGARVSMDDFGTGYSSLSYLKRLPIDVVKIDRAFVSDILSDADDQAILAAIITMAHQLRLQIVAEGVESEEQTELLQRMDCDVIQGFVVSRPLPAELFAAKFLSTRRRLAS